jgi:regulator of sirC expression with transglutaminase-like and TPR domain
MDKEKNPQAVIACEDLLAWMIPQLDKFPRLRRYTLGERIETGLLEVLEQLLHATYSRGQAKAAALRTANLRLGLVRHLWRLGHRLEAMATRQYGHGASLIEDLGRQIGGWYRDTNARLHGRRGGG